ncbi:MAG: agglutinin biogenesis protein MshP [Betaproteobacteria bacterium]|jgi:MSHA biogenesis protein MshP|nr:MAG: agglutinin biogenesis protein MshP [Betaproteobacteria bacterium]
MYRECQRGVGLVTAVFLLVVIAGLISFLLRVSGLQHSTAALDLQGARAFQSARAGIEWGVYRALRDNSCASSASFGLAGDLSDFTVTVRCVDVPYTEVDATVKHVYSIVATACNRPAAGACPGPMGSFYVERQLQALVDQVKR